MTKSFEKMLHRIVSTVFFLSIFLNLSAQTTLYSEDFETGGAGITLNTSDLGGTATPNFWVVNNAYTGGSGSLICLGFPFTYTINSTASQTFHANPSSNYLHTMSIYGQADNIFCSSFAAADGICIFNSSNFCKQNTGINTVGYNNVSFKFWWNCAGGTAIYGEVYYSTNGGSTWTLATAPISQYSNQTNWTQQTVTNPAFNGVADLRFAFRFVNNQSSTAADPGFSIDDIQVIGTSVSTNTITTGTISNLNVCPGNTVQVPFTISGTFTSGNIFTAQLSDGSGTFGSPVNIGTLAGTSAGTITATIPPATPAGTGYRIRVIGSTPSTTGTTNVANITVSANPVAGTAFVTGNGTLCAGTSAQVTLQGFTGNLVWESSPNGTNWSSTGVTTNPLIATLSTNTYFRANVSNGCGTVYSAAVMFTVLPSNLGFANGQLSRDSICDGDTTTVQMNYYGSNITWYTSNNGGLSWNISANTNPNSYHTPPLSGNNQNMVRAIVDNGPCGFDTIDVAIAVESVTASFTETHLGLTYTFSDASTNAVTWLWDFGDGNTSTLQNPVHTYATGGNYTVNLVVSGPFGCLASFTQTVSAPVGIADGIVASLQVSPNPFRADFQVAIETFLPELLNITLLDLQGKMLGEVYAGESNGGLQRINATTIAETLAAGTYCLRIVLGDRVYGLRVVKM
jgi:PKD repeat protein